MISKDFSPLDEDHVAMTLESNHVVHKSKSFQYLPLGVVRVQTAKSQKLTAREAFLAVPRV